MKVIKKLILKKAVKVVGNVGREVSVDDYFTLRSFYKPKKPEKKILIK